MTVNFERMTIVMTKAEAKDAGKFNSEKYNELLEIRSQFPNFRIVTKETPKKRDAYKGLTYEYMEKYIKDHAKEDQTIMDEFNTMRGYENGKKAEFVEVATYGEVKAWFLLKFPEISQYNDKVAELRAKTRKARCA